MRMQEVGAFIKLTFRKLLGRVNNNGVYMKKNCIVALINPTDRVTLSVALSALTIRFFYNS